jgi:hypothetical protein
MAQAVNHRSLTSKSQVRARVIPCGICGGQSGTGTGFSPSWSVVTCQYNFTIALRAHHMEMKNRPFRGRSSETCPHPIDMNNNISISHVI